MNVSHRESRHPPFCRSSAPPRNRAMSRYILLSCVLVPILCGIAPAADRTYHFDNDIEPILSRFGCNSSGCHGKAEGQNGFKLSVFGYDPAADHAALVKEGRGRRVL